MKTELDEIKDLIKRGNLDFAFKKIEKIISNRNADSLILLERQYSKFKSDKIRGVLKNSDGLNEISSNFLNLIKAEINGSNFVLTDSNSNIYNLTIMRDNYNVSQAGAVGPNSTSTNSTFVQQNQHFPADFDFDKLHLELVELKAQLLQNAINPEHYQSIAELAKAEVAAKEKDSKGVIENLKKAGTWVFEFATKVGTSIVSEVIKGYLK